MADFLNPLHQKKCKLSDVINIAFENGLIDRDEKRSIQDKLDNDVLTIGVIGQMKSGKSSFLNALIFDEEVLPVAVDTMTAALTVIQYGPKKVAEAVFYSKEEWDEICETASVDDEEVYGSAADIINSAKELMQRVKDNGLDVNRLLGTKCSTEKLSSLPDYVGKDSKYAPLIKLVNIYYPDETLKGVRIVDTPGFNDSVVSRENLTKQFLNEADVVLLVLYAGMAFNAIDYDILFRQIPQCGIGKILIAVNKYDVIYKKEDGEKAVENVTNYVSNCITTACNEMGRNTLTKILQDVDVIPISALMANIGHTRIALMNSSEKEDFNRLCETFSISTPEQLIEKSRIHVLEKQILSLIQKEKGKVLLDSVYSNILAKSNSISRSNSVIMASQQEIAKSLSKGKDALRSSICNLNAAQEQIREQIEALRSDLSRIVREKNASFANKLELALSNYRLKTHNIIDQWSYTQSYKDLESKMAETAIFFSQTVLPTELEIISTGIKRALKEQVGTFLISAQGILSVYLADMGIDIESEILRASKKIENLANDEIFVDFIINGKKKKFADYLKDTAFGFGFGLIGLSIRRGVKHSSYKKKMKDEIEAKINSFKVSDITASITKRVDKIGNDIEMIYLDELLNPIIEQYNSALEQQANISTQGEVCERKIKEASDKVKKEIAFMEKVKAIGFNVGEL